MARVELLIGPAGSGKTSFVLQAYADQVTACNTESVVLLVPTHQCVEEAKQRLVTHHGLPALVGANIMSFSGIADHLLATHCPCIREISKSAQYLLLRQVIDDCASEGELSYYASVIHSPGFTRVLAEFVSELKRGAVEPENFLSVANTREFSEPRTRGLATVYARYQARLAALNLYDSEGRFWQARNILMQGKYEPFDGMKYLLVDGFSDWTPTEWDVLCLLIEHSETSLITLTLENRENSQRPELFYPTEKTRRRFEQTFGNMTINFMEPMGLEETPLTRVFRDLFVTQEQAARAPRGEAVPGDSVQVFCAPDKLLETQWIARRVKDLLLQGVAPKEIGIIFRDLTEYGPVLRRVFKDFGIPIHTSQQEPLSWHPLIQTVLEMYAIPLHDYRRDDVLEFFGSNYVSLEGFAQEELDITQLDEVTREAGITRGRDLWMRRLETLSERASQRAETVTQDENHMARHNLTLARAAERCARFFSKLCATFDSLDGQARLSCYLDSVPRLCKIFCLGPLASSDFSTHREQLFWELLKLELGVWQQFMDNITKCCNLLHRFPELDHITNLEQFAQTLTSLLDSVPMPCGTCAADEVVVRDILNARGASFTYLILGGLSEKEWPRVVRESPFFTDSERQRLNTQGIMLEERLSLQREEAFLFYLAVTRARRQLYVSFPSADAEGHTLLPSYYVEELERCLGVKPTVARMSVPHSQVTPQISEACNERELTEALFRKVASLLQEPGTEPTPIEIHSAGNLLQTSRPREIAHYLASAEVQQSRYARCPFDVYDGHLENETTITDDLKMLFPPTYHFSVTELETYAACPFRYFAERILHADPCLAPSDLVQPRDRGRIYHTVAHEFFRRLKNLTGSTRITAHTRETAERILSAVIEECFTKAESEEQTASETMWRIEKHVCHAIMRLFLENEEKLPAENIPARFECTFGGKSAPLELAGDEQPILLKGRIDRLDTVGDGGFAVYDYKTGGGIYKRELTDGLALQLPVYALAVKQTVFPGKGLQCVAWGCYLLKRPVEKKHPMRKPEEIEQTIAVAQRHIIAYVNHIRKAHFQVRPQASSCKACQRLPLCRMETWRVKWKLEAERGNRDAC